MKIFLTYLLLAVCLLLVMPSVELALVALLVLGTLHGLFGNSILCVIRGNVDNFKYAETLYPVAVTADKAKDVGVDIIDFDSAAFVVNVGAITAAGVVLPVAQECDELAGTYTDVAAADLEGAFVNCVANTPQKVGYRGTKRFLAIRADYVSGTSVVLGGSIVAGDPHVKPVE